MAEIQRRQIARKIPIADITDSSFVKEEGFEPSYIVHKYGNITRVNVVGIIVENSTNEFYEGITVDDGTGKVAARSFEKKGMFNGLSVGNVVQIIGKIREYNGERYVGCEAVKDVGATDWLNLRKKEWVLLDKKLKKVNVPEIRKSESSVKEEVVEGDVNSKVYSIIKQLDTGNGADIDEIIKKANISKCEEIIKKMLMNGDVFEIRPGKIKTLE
jgi:RPA family protein